MGKVIWKRQCGNSVNIQWSSEHNNGDLYPVDIPRSKFSQFISRIKKHLGSNKRIY